MNDEIISGLLNNSGIKVISITDSVLKIEDPGCIIRSFEKLINYGWILISIITAVLIFGWAIAYIRGSKISSILDNFKNNLDKLNIDCDIIDTNIWEIANEKAKDYPCFLCAKMRRGILYTQVEELGFNKLTLGHHFDDVIETTLINMLYAGTIKTMTPKVFSTSGKLELIRPLVYVKEVDIIDYTKTNGICAMNCGCTIEAGKTSSKRREIKNLLAELEEKNPGVKQSVFNSMKNINLET